ncbi:MAG: polysaccharide deacetylase, partial [Verrucomicrobiota bacterium]
LAIFESTVGFRPKGYRAPWYEINPWTPKLLEEQGFQYQSSLMSDDVPFFHANGLIEIPPQWHLEDWEQFAFNPDPAWGVIPEDCEKVYRLWWEELSAMRDYGCACVLTLHPWLIGRPARIQLLERILRKALELGDIWITTGSAIASHLTAHPNSRREVDLDA